VKCPIVLYHLQVFLTIKDIELILKVFKCCFIPGLFSEMIALKQGLEEYSDSSDLNSDDEVNLA